MSPREYIVPEHKKRAEALLFYPVVNAAV